MMRSLCYSSVILRTVAFLEKSDDAVSVTLRSKDLGRINSLLLVELIFLVQCLDFSTI